MLHKPVALLAMLLASAAAMGQGTGAPPAVIGSVEKVKGLVTVSDAKSIASVVEGSKLVDGARIVTSSTGTTTLRTDTGCRIELGPNQSLTLLGRKSCEALVASIQLLPGEFTGRQTLLAAAALLTGALLGQPDGSRTAGTPPGSGGPIPEPPISNQ